MLLLPLHLWVRWWLVCKEIKARTGVEILVVVCGMLLLSFRLRVHGCWACREFKGAQKGGQCSSGMDGHHGALLRHPKGRFRFKGVLVLFLYSGCASSVYL